MKTKDMEMRIYKDTGLGRSLKLFPELGVWDSSRAQILIIGTCK